MTTVNISGTWSEKQRPNNGLSTHADLIRKDRILRVPVVGYVEYHQWTEKLTGNVLTVSIPVIEPAIDADGSDPRGEGKRVMDLLDALRKERGKGSVEDVPRGGEIAGQLDFDFDGPGDDDESGETRMTDDGERAVPPPSGEELAAELDERRAAKKAGKAAPGVAFAGGEQA